MSGGVTSLMIKWTVEKLSSFITQGTNASVGDLQELQAMMERIYSVLKDGDERDNILDNSERHRLKELKDVAYEADDIIDEYEYEGSQPYDHVHPPVPHELVGASKKIIKKFDEIIGGWEKLRWGESNDYGRVDIHSGKRPSSTSLVHKPDIHGRDEDNEKVIHMVLSENRQRSSSVSVLPITGMAGVGKTTLARLVYNDSEIINKFDLRGWVCVGGELDVGILTKNILMSFTEQNCDLTEVEKLQRRLMNDVRGKRLFLVLDDVWNHDATIWDSLKAPFVSAQSSTIIVTTYNMEVARVMKTMPPYSVEPLSFDHSWSLFKQSAFQDSSSNVHNNLLEIGKNIVRKCGGLPLTVKAIGAALRHENDEDKWNDILESDSWESDSIKGSILPALKLSYERMPIHLKQCFLFFSLFPKEFVMLKDKIIRLWMSLGLLRPECRRSMEEIGCDTFDGIFQWSMIQQTQHEGVDAFVLHHLFHNLFGEMQLEEEYTTEKSGILNEISKKVRYLSLMNEFQNTISFCPCQSSKTLRLLQILDPKNRWNNYHINAPIQGDSLDNLRHLRALDFTGCLIEELPDSIGNLKHLRYLCLTNTGIDQLPESICNLHFLQTLELIMCPIKKLPDGINKLINLRHLNFQQWFPICMPCGIGRLVDLRTLPRFHVGRDDWHCDITELNGLVNLRGELCISGLITVSTAESANQANLHNKQYLKLLRLEWSSETSPMCCNEGSSMLGSNHGIHERCSIVLENLKPHHNLKVLEIFGFPGNRYPSWLGHGSFTKLVKISLIGNVQDSCEFLPTLGQLPCLETLSIKSLCRVRDIGREFCSPNESTVGFPSLETLSFDDMPSWTGWSGVKNGDFSSLRELKIVDCPLLNSLPEFSSTSLTTLEIQDCASLVEVPAMLSIRSLNLKGRINGGIFSSLVMPSLRSFKVRHLKDIKSIRLNQQNIQSLEVLVIHDCKNLATIVGLSDLNSLKLLKLSACRYGGGQTYSTKPAAS